MIYLSPNCRYSDPSVSPASWQIGDKALLSKRWYIQYRFFDDNFADKYPKGKQRFIKLMNSYKTLAERIKATKILLDDIQRLHQVEGFNLITGQYATRVHIEYEISPDLPVTRALDKALTKLKCEKRTLTDIRNSLTHVKKSIRSLGYDVLPIKDVTRRHIRAVLDNCEHVKKYWSNSLFNNYRKYLSMLFNELIELEAIEHHPVTHIAKRKTVTKVRPTLSRDDRAVVNNHLFTNHYTFWRYMQIFFHSGRRSTELLAIRREDVDLEHQRFKIVDKKGKSSREKWCAIKTVALPYWQEVLGETLSGQYLFSRNLVPGDSPIGADRISKKWKRLVKDELGIEADFYSLKHSNADDIAHLYGLATAQGFIGHTSEKVTRIYATGQGERDLDAMKRIDNKFSEE